MKSTKKILAVLLALVMTMALTVTAFATTTNPTEDTTPVGEATTGNGKITITVNPPADNPDQNATNETYTAYMIFRVEKGAVPAEGDQPITYYLINPTTDPAADNDKALIAAVKDVADEDGNKYFTATPSADGTRTTFALVNENTDPIKLADALLAALKAANIAGTALQVGDNTVDAGYYLITSTLGTNLILATADFTVEEKNLYPSVTKSVDKAAAQIGDTLTYTLTVTIPKSAKGEIVLTDTMAAGITYAAATAVEGVTFAANGQTLTVTLSEDYVEANKGTTVTFTYTATLNTSAVIGQKSGEVISGVVTGYATDGNFNTVYLTYSQFKTQTYGVDTDTYEATIKKVDKKTNAPLPGAKFTVARADGTPVKFTLTNGVYVVDPAGTVTEVESDANGLIKIQGLNTETYVLTETDAPDGYNLLEGTKDLVVTAGTNAIELTVENETGTVLPSTGGIGTKLFYVVGAILVIGAGVVLVARKRVED
ncbi:MAG: isopeptide-forming domain-containing fimbrial protein [Ruminococcaceae bacterium]|jgi:fimbrial isopeptide formation D2 family protein/LPXTG-motif cell wall-anchored protein|nr:isopeptide-forming domain-containing fimbrial protein [Oscillospiraceae bacterium]